MTLMYNNKNRNSFLFFSLFLLYAATTTNTTTNNNTTTTNKNNTDLLLVVFNNVNTSSKMFTTHIRKLLVKDSYWTRSLVVDAFTPNYYRHHNYNHPQVSSNLLRRGTSSSSSSISRSIRSTGNILNYHHSNTPTTRSTYNRNYPYNLLWNKHIVSSTIQDAKTVLYARFTTEPDFIDDKPGQPSSYQIPPYQEGDDTITSSKLRKNQRIVSFGDVHGDILALYKFLQASQLLHANSTLTNPIWDGGDSILVQCGDILDRGPNELFCLRYLASIARQAAKHNGKVLILHGNHESLNANGLFHYTDAKGDVEIESVLGEEMDKVKSEGSKRWRLQYAGNQPARWNAFEPGGWLSQPLLCNMNVAVVVGKTLFVHGGLTKDHLMEYGGLTKMNKDVREWYAKPLPQEFQNDYGYNFKTVEDVINTANARAQYISKNQPGSLGGGIGAASPVWMRDYSSPADGVPKQPQRAQKMINECLDQLSNDLGEDVQRVVMGHTPQDKINSALQNKAWRVDVGASFGVAGGTPEVLEIIHCGGENDEDIINVLTVDGKRIPAIERETMEVPFI